MCHSCALRAFDARGRRARTKGSEIIIFFCALRNKEMNTGDRSTYSMTPSQAMESLLADVRRTQRSSTDDSYSMFNVSPEQVIGEHASHPTTDVASRIIQYDTIVSEGLVGQGSHRFLSNAHSCEMETYSMDQQCSNLADSESSSYAESSTATVTYSMTRSSSMSSVKRRPTSMSSSLGRAARNIQYAERSPEITGWPGIYSMTRWPGNRAARNIQYERISRPGGPEHTVCRTLT